MTPNLKALGLQCEFSILDNTVLGRQQYKEAARICVEQILKLNTWCDVNHKDALPEDTKEFWLEVKEKINML